MKILYNTTFKIIHPLREEWVQWMKNVHIPKVMATGYFESQKFCKLLGHDESDGATYTVQYLAPSRDAYNDYLAKSAPVLQQEHRLRYINKFVSFSTLLEVL